MGFPLVPKSVTLNDLELRYCHVTLFVRTARAVIDRTTHA